MSEQLIPHCSATSVAFSNGMHDIVDLKRVMWSATRQLDGGSHNAAARRGGQPDTVGYRLPPASGIVLTIRDQAVDCENGSDSLQAAHPRYFFIDGIFALPMRRREHHTVRLRRVPVTVRRCRCGSRERFIQQHASTPASTFPEIPLYPLFPSPGPDSAAQGASLRPPTMASPRVPRTRTTGSR